MTKKWSSDLPADLLSLIDDHYTADQACKREFAKMAEENIRFIDGDQYITYHSKSNEYQPIPNRVDREYVPRATDNQLYLRADIIRANLTRQQPIFNITANTQDPKDEKLSKVALAVHDSRVEYDDDSEKIGEASDWAITTGNCFLKTAWVPTQKIPSIDSNGEVLKDAQGNDLLISLGDVETSVPSPFRIAPDKNATNLRGCDVIMEYSLQRTSDVTEWYDVVGVGYTGEAKNLADESVDESSILRIEERLKDYQEKGRAALKEFVVLKEVYIRPSEELPQGRMIVAASGKILYVGVSPYAVCDIKKWHPYSHFAYKTQPGRFWGLTPVTQGVRLQRRLNAIDTMMILHRQTMSLGQWLIPVGSVKDGAISGRLGLKIQYKLGARGEKPEKINGTELGQDMFLERTNVIQSMDSIFGTADVMQAKSLGDSGVALEVQREMAFSRFNPVYQRWEKFIERSAQLRLSLIARKQSSNNPEFTKLLRNKLRGLTGLDVQQFIGSDIQKNTNLRITAGSTIPKSHASKLSFLQKFGEAGILGDLVQDPMKNQLFLSAFGIDNFKTSTNVDWEKAKYELSQIEVGEMPVVDVHDNHQLHNEYFKTKLMDPEWYSSRDPRVAKAAWAHYEAHQAQLDQAQEEGVNSQRMQQDEGAYRQSLVNSGGPNGDPPSLSLFPSVLKQQVETQKA